MAALLDSAGNVNTAVADDVASFEYALRAASAVPQAAPVAAANGTKLASDSLTGYTGGAANNGGN